MPDRISKPIKSDSREAPDVDRSLGFPDQKAPPAQCPDDCENTTPSDKNSDFEESTEREVDDGKPPLGPDEFAILKEMIGEYKACRMDFSCLPRRPRFKVPRVNSGFTCSSEIRRRASAKAKTDPHGTGGSLSSLIELLLWKYIGCPTGVVEPPSGGDDDP